MPVATQSPAPPPPEGLPSFMTKMLPPPPGQTRVLPPKVKPEKEELWVSPDTLYEYLWPTMCWTIAIFNLTVMICTMFSIAGNYNPLAHAEVSIISIFSFGALAMIYKWVIMAPTDKNVYVWPGHLPGQQNDT